MSQRLRILLVDDEINMLESLGDILRAERYHVSTASSGKEAIKRLETEDAFDLVITDLKMPVMGGMELLKRVSKGWPSVRVIVLTGHGSVDSAVEAMRAGAWDFMLKPFQPEEALATIDRLNHQKHGLFAGSTFMSDLSETFGFDSIIGNSPAVMQDVVDKAEAYLQNVLNSVGYRVSFVEPELQNQQQKLLGELESLLEDNDEIDESKLYKKLVKLVIKSK